MIQMKCQTLFSLKNKKRMLFKIEVDDILFYYYYSEKNIADSEQSSHTPSHSYQKYHELILCIQISLTIAWEKWAKEKKNLSIFIFSYTTHFTTVRVYTKLEENCLEEVQGAATSSLFMPPLFQNTRPCVHSCMRSAMLHASETWPLTKPNLQHLQWNDSAMIRQICNVRSQDVVATRSNEVLARLGIEDLDPILKE